MNKIIPLQEMIKEIKKHYNLNDTLLALNLKVTPQTVKGWKDGNIPREKTYNKILEIYNNIINSEEQTKEVTEVTEKKPYEISYPIGYALMWYLDDCACVTSYQYYNTAVDRVFYESGLLFDSKEEAEQFKREQTLIKKIKCWTKEQQGDWNPDWDDIDQRKYYVNIDRFNKETFWDWHWEYDKLSKLPYFKSKEIAEACIDEFGDEILEVFC